MVALDFTNLQWYTQILDPLSLGVASGFHSTARLLNGSLANVTFLRFAAMVPAGAIADAVGSTVRVPFVAWPQWNCSSRSEFTDGEAK